MNCKNKSAFTLIEILIVIAIIGVLAGVIMVSSNAGRLKAKDTVIISSVDTLIKAAQVECGIEGNYLKCADGAVDPNPSLWYGYSFSDVASPSMCDGHFSLMTQSASMLKVCKQIISNWDGVEDANMATMPGRVLSPPGRGRLIIRMWLPGKRKIFCKDTDGKASSDMNEDGTCPTGCLGCN